MKSKSNAKKAVLVVAAAVFAASLFGASTASAALPEIIPAPSETKPLKFTATSTPGVALYTVFTTAQCAAASATGEFINSKEVRNVIVTWGSQCSNCFGNGEGGAFVSKPLKGTLGYLQKSKHEVGLRLEGETGSQPLWTEGRCGSLNIRIVGKLIGNLWPVNRKVKTTEFLTYEARSSGAEEQEWQKFEGALLERSKLSTIETIGGTEREMGAKFKLDLGDFTSGGNRVETEISG